MKNYLILFLTKEKMVHQIEVSVPVESNEGAAMIAACRLLPESLGPFNTTSLFDIVEIKWFLKA
jgi:hypothetical protein